MYSKTRLLACRINLENDIPSLEVIPISPFPMSPVSYHSQPQTFAFVLRTQKLISSRAVNQVEFIRYRYLQSATIKKQLFSSDVPVLSCLLEI